MHARVSVFQMAPDDVDAGIEYGRGTLTQMMQMEGFLGNLALVDRQTERITSVTLWESENAMVSSEEGANTMRSSGAADVSAEVVSVDRLEVGYFVQPSWGTFSSPKVDRYGKGGGRCGTITGVGSARRRVVRSGVEGRPVARRSSRLP